MQKHNTQIFQAATRIRTGDLVLTKDALYQLSHISTPISFNQPYYYT